MHESVLCAGEGAISVELDFLMQQFVRGSASLSRVLDQPQISERASNLLERKFKRIGIEVRKHTSATAIRRGAKSWKQQLTPTHPQYSRAHSDVVPGIYASPGGRKNEAYCSPVFCSSMRACSSSVCSTPLALSNA